MTLVGSPAWSQGATRPTSGVPDFSRLRDGIPQRMLADSVPGLAIAVVRRGEILWEEGFGWADRERGVRVTEQTPIYLSSVTKSLTATALMMLAERGVIDLDRPANQYLAPAGLSSPRWDPAGATVRRVATHTAGLTTYHHTCAANQRDCRVAPTDELIRRYGVLIWPAGERFDYSNFGYGVVGEVVARASRRDLPTFLRDELFRPLGMSRSSIGVRADLAAETAVRYKRMPGPSVPRTETASGSPAASSAYASAHDLALFGRFALKTRQPGQPAILSDAGVDTMLSSMVEAVDGLRYGLGWWIEQDRFGYRSVLAQGGTDDSSARLRLIPSEGIAVIVLANTGTSLTTALADDALALLLPGYRARLAAQRALPVALAGSWSGFVRTWRGDVPLTVEVSESGEVVAQAGGRPAPISGVRFADGRFTAQVTADLGVAEEIGSEPYTVQLDLNHRDGALQGAATTNYRPGLVTSARLSFWTELTRRDAAIGR